MRVAILGCAHMHVQSYVNSLKALDVEIIGLSDNDMDSGKNFCIKNDIKFYEDVNNLLDLKPDAVIVTSENSLHKYYSLKAAEHNCHIILEKPIATNEEDAVEIIHCAKIHGVKLMICFPVRYSNPIKELKKSLSSIGDIRSIVATNHGSMPGGWFVEKDLSGGGSVIDHTVHVADIIHWFLDLKVKKVYSVMDTLFHDLDVEDSGLILIEFENGAIASIDTSWNRPKSYPAWGDVVLDFHGTKDSIRVDAFSERGMLYRDELGKPIHYNFGSDMDFEMIKDFVDAIENDKPSPVTGEDGLYALKIALIAYDFNEKEAIGY